MEAWKLLKHQTSTMWKECTICSGMRKGDFIGNYHSKGGEKHIFLCKLSEQPFSTVMYCPLNVKYRTLEICGGTSR